MQRLDFEATKQSGNKYSSSTTSRQTGESIASLNYHLDYRSLPDPDVVNAFILPPRGLADRLFQVYLNKVQITLPFLRHDLFLDQYRRCFETTQKPGRKWLAVFNLILAIGCVFSRLCQEGIGHDTNEDLFFARARALSGSENILYDHDDLQQVQAEALTAFFFLVVSQINRYDYQNGA